MAEKPYNIVQTEEEKRRIMLASGTETAAGYNADGGDVTDERVEADFARAAMNLETLAKDMTALLRIYTPVVFKDDGGKKIYDEKQWLDSTPGKILNKYLNYNPHAEKSIDEILEKAEKASTPELYELCRIEKALTYILGCLSVLAGPAAAGSITPHDRKETDGFPWNFSYDNRRHE